MSIDASQRTRCREIGPADLCAVANLLTKGFRTRTRQYWARALRHLSAHPTPSGYPPYGYLLEHNETPVGVSLLIYSSILSNGEVKIRCNVSSWYVEPLFRSYASMLVSHGREHPNITYFNVTPGRHTLMNIETRGYARYCNGLFLAIPALSKSPNDVDACTFTPGLHSYWDLPPTEVQLLEAHARYGCISLICNTPSQSYPFVFAPHRKNGFFSYLRLIYCRAPGDFVRFSGALGRFLARYGFFFVALDSNGPIDGLFGRYFDERPKYFKGPDRPRLGDLAYTELAMFEIAGDWIWKDWLFRAIRESRPSQIGAKKNRF